MFKVEKKYRERDVHLLYSLTNHTRGFNQNFLRPYLKDLQR